MKKEISNIKQVAEKAGVSMMTVSRALNAPELVAEDTRKKVMKAIEECHYYPNSFARGLASNKTYIIGIVIYDSYRTRHNMFYEMINGIERIASDYNYNIMLFSYKKGEDYKSRIVESGLVDGVIFMGITMNYNDIRYLDEIKFPYVVIGKRNIEDLEPYSVVLDYREAFRKATRYLIESGCEEIGFDGVARGFEPDMDKMMGYQQAFYEAGKLCNPNNILFFEGIHLKKSNNCISDLYDRGIHTFVLTDCDRMREIIEFASERKLRIPEDLKICIFNDEKMNFSDILHLTELTDRKEGYSVPQIEMNQYYIGKRAAQFLFSRIKGDKDLPRTTTVALDIKLQ